MTNLDADKKQENPSLDCTPKERVILPAEKRFNWLLYGGLNYGIQVTTAVLATEWMKHGGGKAYFQKAAEWAGEHIIPKVTNKRGALAIKETNTYLIGATQLMVGNLFFVPIKWFENRKAHFVRKIDEKMIKQQEAKGFTITPEERQKHEEALEALDKVPRTSWPTLITARTAGIASFFVSNWLIGETKSKWMQEKAADGVQYALKNSGIGSLKKLGHSPRIRNFSEIAFVDFFYSIAVASTVFMVTNALTKKQHKAQSKAVAQPASSLPVVEQETSPDETQKEQPRNFADKHPRKEVKAAASPRGSFVEHLYSPDVPQPQVAL